MEKMVNIQIEKHEENKEVYYLATSEDVQGLVAQGATIEETLEIAQSLIKDLIEVRAEIDKEKEQELKVKITTEEKIKLFDIPQIFQHHLFIQA